MSNTLNHSGDTIDPFPQEQQQQPLLQRLGSDTPESLRYFSRTPRPYHHDGLEVRQDLHDGRDERYPSSSNVVPEQGGDQRSAVDGTSYHGQHSGQASVAGSESGTEADDERPPFVKALPPALLRPRKGLKTGEKSEDALLTPSQLDDEGSYFRRRAQDVKTFHKEDKVEEEKLMRLRLGEFVRRVSEVALMGMIIACVMCGKGVLQLACQWWRELLSHVIIIAVLILAYPVKLSIVDTSATNVKLWQRFRVPASFDPATILYPPLLPVLVALSVSSADLDVVLPNIILGLASLPQRVFPRSSRLGGVNVLHWLVSTIPLIASSWCLTGDAAPHSSKSGAAGQLPVETLVSLYPLHHSLLQPLHYLTTTSLLMSELHLLSAVLINLLLLAMSPQTTILKACLWIGGTVLFVSCGPILNWNVTLARLPKWKLRRSAASSKERRSLVDAVSDLINFQRAIAAFSRSSADVDSDADEDMPVESIKQHKSNGMPKLRTRLTMPSFVSRNEQPVSAIEPRHFTSNEDLSGPEYERPRSRRYTLPEHDAPPFHASSSRDRRRARSKLAWYLQLTPSQLERRKRSYAIYFYLVVVAIVFGPIRRYIAAKALYGHDPFGWAVGYLLGQIPVMRAITDALDLQAWAPLPPQSNIWLVPHLTLPFDVSSIRDTLGLANVRLLLIGYWAAVLLVGLLAVFNLTASVEVDTRRKIFHSVMVAMLTPSMFVDPCYCALTLALVLVVFLLLEVIRAGQVPPLGNAIGRFIAPYVDGRDLRGPVVVSHIFLLIGCAVPLWFSLASINRGDDRPPWIGWELANNQREVAMVAGVICVGMGDAAASLIGRRYGRRKWIWVGGKSLEGSAAFSVAVTIGLMATKMWLVFGGWSDTGEDLRAHLGVGGSWKCVMAWFVTLAKAVLCASGASFMEAVLTGANDNVVVPVALWLLVKGLRV